MSNGTGLVSNPPINPGEQTPCSQGGPELLPAGIAATTTSALVLDVMICNGSGDVRVDIDKQQVFTQQNTQHATCPLPALTPGAHVLVWSVQTNAPNWQTRDEVTLNGNTVFRRRKSAAGSNPVNMGFLFIQVS